MKYSHHLILATLALCTAFCTAKANTYEVTMTCTVTDSNDDRFTQGTVFQNQIFYDSAMPDGSYHALDNSLIGSQLTGTMVTEVPEVQNSLVYDYLPLPIETTGPDDVSHNHLTVLNSDVTDFLWDVQRGFSYSYYTAKNFTFNVPDYRPVISPTDPQRPNLRVTGTVEFGEVSELVPESSSTISYLIPACFAFFPFGLLRSKRRH